MTPPETGDWPVRSVMIIITPGSQMYEEWPQQVTPWILVRLTNIIMVVKMLKMELFNIFMSFAAISYNGFMVMIHLNC